MTENDISTIVLRKSIEIHNSLGPGLYESVYEEILFSELLRSGLFVNRQKAIPVIWKDKKLDHGFRADLIIENKVLLEIKSVESIAPVHYKQVLTYLKLTELKLGLLINFNEYLVKDGYKRIVNNL
jgi:GxxExxY protein